MVRGHSFAHDTRCAGGWEAAHVQPDLGDDHLCVVFADAGDLVEPLDRGESRAFGQGVGSHADRVTGGSAVDPRRDGPTSGHPVGVTADTLAECARLTTVERLDEIAGIGEHNAQVIIAEIGLDMSRFPTPAHLVSWAKLCPRTIQSGPVTRGGHSGKGNPYLKGVLGDAAAAAAKTSTFLGERYRRIVKRRGKLKALVAVARSILVIVWHLLNDPTARFHDLGPDDHTNRIATERRMRNHIAQLTAMGYLGHPRTRRLNQTHTGTTSPGSARPAGYCRLPTHLGYFSDRDRRPAR